MAKASNYGARLTYRHGLEGGVYITGLFGDPTYYDKASKLIYTVATLRLIEDNFHELLYTNDAGSYGAC
jgi:hypothetical protein